jgi:ubiquinone/menaquinone biosynthesis C-methylase UbiE
MLSAIGPGMKAGRQIDEIFRYYILHALDEVGVFKFLEQPRTYGEILANFGFIDSTYTRDIINTLTKDKDPAIIQEEDFYQRNHDVPIPDLQTVLAAAPGRLHVGRFLGEGLYENILDRLRQDDLDLEGVFVRDDQRLVTNLKQLLESPLYTKVRIGCFDLLPNAQRNWLDGKKLLEIGCGNGYETAELWLHTQGCVKITGVDLVPNMIEMAEEKFTSYLERANQDHISLTSQNMPTFKVGDVMNLEFDDNSFDASYTMLVLHWVPDPERAIREIIRVVKPGGLIFGAQPYKPYINPYVDLIIRSSRNSNGFFWKEDFIQWFREYGLQTEIVTPAGIFRVTNSPEASDLAVQKAHRNGTG